MSSVQSFTLTFDENEGTEAFIENYVEPHTSDIDVYYYSSAMRTYTVLQTGNSATQMIDLNAYAKSKLYPNDTAHPIYADFYSRPFGSYALLGNMNEGAYYFDGVPAFTWQYKPTAFVYQDDKSATGSTHTSILNSTRQSTLSIGISASRGTGGIVRGNMVLYFNRYDFSATAGTGVASAQVTDANGFDGDSITYLCTLQSGATFSGWYLNGVLYNSNQSFVHTVSGQDLTLEARAVPGGSGALTATYNGNTLFSQTLTGTVTVTYNGSTIATIQRGTTKTIACAGKVCSGNLVIGGKTLVCAGKQMERNVMISYGT